MVKVIRKRLPHGWAAFHRCWDQTVFVDVRLSDGDARRAKRWAAARCGGVFGLVNRAELRRAA
jgi:hypothetical protein